MSYVIPDVAVLMFAFTASAALGVGTAYALHRWSRKRWVWALTPVFFLLWISLGAASLVSLYYFTAKEVLPGPSPP